MRKNMAILVASFLLLGASPAFADLFALEADAQGSYVRVDNVSLPESDASGTISGMGAGFRGRLQILFLNALVDYHHLFTGGKGADLLHVGLGVGYRTDMLPVIDIYVQGSIGLLMLAADGSAFGDNTSGYLDPEMGGQIRGGGGIEIPFASDFLAIGVGVDFGGHYITGKFGYDMSVNAHFGLRI